MNKGVGVKDRDTFAADILLKPYPTPERQRPTDNNFAAVNTLHFAWSHGHSEFLCSTDNKLSEMFIG